MNLQEALPLAQDGNCMLFLGAGASWGAKNRQGASIPVGKQFAETLSATLQFPSDTPLDRLADFYIEDFGSSALIDLLRETFTVSAVAEHHRQLAGIDWMRVYTTNYDDAYAFARREVKKSITSAVLSDRPDSKLSATDCCLHINGSISHLTADSLTTEVKLSTTSYLTQHFQESEWVDVFRTDLRLADAVFFVGYSLYDLDIQRLIFETPKNRAKTFFIVAPDERRDSERILSKFGSVDKIGVQYLGTLLQQAKDSRRASTQQLRPQLRKWLKYVPADPSIPDVREDDILRLLLWGRIDESLEEKVAINPAAGPYYFPRVASQRIYEKLQADRSCVVVHSHLGNGKSVIERQVCRQLFDNDIDVYSILASDAEANREGRNIVAQAEKPTVIVIGNYPSCIDLVNDLSAVANRHVRYLLFSRSSPNDVTFPLLRESLRERTTEVPVNRVHADDLQSIADYFTKFALWQEFSGKSWSEKIKLLRNDCASELSSMLLLLLRSPQIHKRLEEVVATFQKDAALCDALIAVMVLNAIGSSYTAETVLDLVDAELPRRIRRAADTRLSDIVDLAAGRIVARSPVAASYLLQEIFKPDRVVPVLVRLATEAAKRRHVHQGLLTELVRYGNVQSVLAHGQGRLSAAVDYYEQARRIPWLNESIHFWLQYGIARLSLQSSVDDIAHAERYFDTAYAMATRLPGYNTNMIDNHYARLLLVKAQYPQFFEEWFALWSMARDILVRQAGRHAERHYPYKVVSLVDDLYEYLAGRMSDSERSDLLNFCRRIVKSIETLTPEAQEHVEVRNCRRRLERLLTQHDLKVEQSDEHS